MTAASLASAAACASLFLGSGAVVGLAVKRAFFASWRGSLGIITVVLVGICWALVVGQLLGAVGGLRTAPLLGAALASAVVAELASRRLPGSSLASGAQPDDEAAPAPTPPQQAAVLVATVLLVLLVAAIWIARTVIAVRRGINDPDSLGYHLPFATTFAQTGYADQHRFVFPTLPVHFYPANDELLAAIGLVLTRSIVFAVVKNLVFGGLVLVAAHALGKAFNAGLLAVGAAAISLGVPVMAFSQPGEAVNDALLMLVLLGGAAVLAHARDRPAPYVLALACAGAAYGTKFSGIVPGVALGLFAVGLLVARLPAHRVRTAVVGALASLAVGGSWYLRNALTFDNPIPPADISLGPFQLRHIETEVLEHSFSVAWYLVRGRQLGFFWDGLGQGLGPLFLVVLAAVAYGVVAGLRSGDGFRRGLAVLTLVTTVGYLTTPAGAYGEGGIPGGFVINLHYAAPVLLIGLVAAAVAIGPRRWAWALPAVGCVVAATGISPGRKIPFWATEVGGPGFVLLVAASLAGGVVAWLWLQPSLRRWARPGAAATAALAVVAVALIVPRYPRLVVVDPVQAWAASVPPTTIGAWVPAVGLLYGPGVPNKVVTLTRDVEGAPVPLDSCPEWMQALRDGGYPYTGVLTGTGWQRWLEADPAFELVAQNGYATVYRVVGEPDVSCPGAG